MVFGGGHDGVSQLVFHQENAAGLAVRQPEVRQEPDPEFQGVDWLAGPSAGLINSAIALPHMIARGDKVAGTVVDQIRANLPLSNLFYTKLAMDYLIWNGLMSFFIDKVQPSTVFRQFDNLCARVFSFCLFYLSLPNFPGLSCCRLCRVPCS